MSGQNKLTKIGIVSVYFGELPNYISLWMESAKCNPTIDFFIVNDKTPVPHPQNVKFISMNLQQFSDLAAKKLELPVDIKSPYKCCDFKPAYGLILEDYLKDYDFWGHCDLDLIWGNLRAFITEEILMNYDRVFPLGHLSLYRNTERIKRAFMLEGSEKGNYDEIFTSEKHVAFDELRGVYLIFQKNGIPQYDEYTFADISPVFKQFKVVTHYTNYSSNFKHQVFVWHNGRIIRKFIADDGSIGENDYAYLHLQKRKFSDEQISVDCEKDIMFNPNGFFNTDYEHIGKKDIINNNRYRGKLYEKLEWKKRNWSLR